MTKYLPSLLLYSVLLALPLLTQCFQTLSARRTSVIPRRTAPATVPSRTRSTVLVLSYNDDEELPKFNGDTVPQEKNDNKPTNDNNDNNYNGATLWERLNDVGQSLKPKAIEVNGKAEQATKMKSKILRKAQACLYWTLYMGYRGYRGFFVILPAVFREVYQKMEGAVDFRVLDDENSTSTLTGIPGDINPTTGNVRWRTRITVSVLSGIVTLTYVVGGLARVLVKFVKTILSTSSLSGSFSAAAEEVEGNEGRLMRLSGKNSSKGSDSRTINGRRGRDEMGF